MKFKIIKKCILCSFMCFYALLFTDASAENSLNPEYVDKLFYSCENGSSESCSELMKLAEIYKKQQESQEAGMFGFGKKKLLKKMDGLSSVAQMAVYLSQKEAYEKTMDSEDAAYFGAAISNYLFGKSPDPSHVEKFTLNKIEAAGDKLIQNNEIMRELVVQSLRVISIVAHAVGKEAVGMDILEQYGSQYPQSPNPETYEILVANSIQHMSPYVQQSLSEMQR